MRNWIIVIGNPVDGFAFIGPFSSNTEAIEWAEGSDQPWWIIELEDPEDE